MSILRDLFGKAEPPTAALHDGDDDVRFRAVESLGKIGDQHAVEPLISVFREDENSAVRDSAARSLGQIGAMSKDNTICSRLAAELMSVPELSRNGTGVCEALEKIGPIIEDAGLREQVVDFLIDALKKGDVDVRRWAIYALENMTDVRGLEPITAALTDEHWSVREAASEALKKTGGTDRYPKVAEIPSPTVQTASEDEHATERLADRQPKVAEIPSPTLPTVSEDDHATERLAIRRNQLKAIKEQTCMLLSQPRVVNSGLSLQPREIVIALERLGFEFDEELVWEAVNELVAERKLVRSGVGVRAGAREWRSRD